MLWKRHGVELLLATTLTLVSLVCFAFVDDTGLPTVYFFFQLCAIVYTVYILSSLYIHVHTLCHFWEQRPWEERSHLGSVSRWILLHGLPRLVFQFTDNIKDNDDNDDHDKIWFVPNFDCLYTFVSSGFLKESKPNTHCSIVRIILR